MSLYLDRITSVITAFTGATSHCDLGGHKATSGDAPRFVSKGIHTDRSIEESLFAPGEYVTLSSIRPADTFTVSGDESLILFHHHSS